MFLNVFVVGLSLLSLSLMDSMPLVNSLCHWNVVAWDMGDSQNTFKCFCTFSLHYDQVSHKTKLWRVDLNFLPWPFYQSGYTRVHCVCNTLFMCGTSLELSKQIFCKYVANVRQTTVLMCSCELLYCIFWILKSGAQFANMSLKAYPHCAQQSLCDRAKTR